MASDPKQTESTAEDSVDESTDEPAVEPTEKLLGGPRVLPLVALRETVIFPEMIVPLQVGREKSVKALDAAVAEDSLIPAAPLGELREEVSVVLKSVGEALAGESVTASQRRMIEMAATMLNANVGRDDPEQIRLAMDMVREAVAAVAGGSNA